MANSKTKTQKKLKPKLQLIYTTWPSELEAQEAARMILTDKLAACVNLWPMESQYLWQNRLETAKEWVLLVKTDSSRLKKCRDLIQKLHPYDVPCLLALTPTSCNPDFEAWLLGSK